MRKVSQVGLHGCSASESMSRCNHTALPAVLAGIVFAAASNPREATSAASTLCRMFAQTSPIACTSFCVFKVEYRYGFIVTLVLYGCDRIPAALLVTYWPMM